MAAVTTVLKTTSHDAIVRVTATAGADTASITLASLAATNETTGTPKVHIARIYHAQTGDATVNVTRDSVVVASLVGYGDVENWAITDQEEEDITVTFGSAGMIILHLKKVGGFNSPIEYAQFGAYDDETAVGS